MHSAAKTRCPSVSCAGLRIQPQKTRALRARLRPGGAERRTQGKLAQNTHARHTRQTITTRPKKKNRNTTASGNCAA